MKKTFVQNTVIIWLFLCQGLSYAQELIPYRYGELWGYCTPDKKIVIKPQYNRVRWFSEGLAAVSNQCRDCYDNYDGKWGYIDKSGKIIIPIEYNSASNFVNDTAIVVKGDSLFCINKNGKILKSIEKDNLNGSYPDRIPESYFEKYFSNKTPSGFEPKISSNYSLIGYVSKKNRIEYWEDPEAAFFFPVTQSIEKMKKGEKIFDTQDLSIRDFFNIGKKMKPSFTVIEKKDNHDLDVVKVFPVEMEYSSDKDNFFVKVNNPAEIVSYYQNLKQPNQKMVLAVSKLIPCDEIKDNLLFQINSKGIDFKAIEHNSSLFGYRFSMYEWITEYEDYLTRMAEEIRFIGKAMKEQNDSQNQKITGEQNPYKGKMLFDVMEQCTAKDLEMFLEYVSVRPFIYMGNSWNLAEVFATWVVEGAPRVVKK